MKRTDPFLKVFVTRPDIDYIHLSREENPNGPDWKADGFRNEKLVAPDLFYEGGEFYIFLSHLSDYIDDTARWTDGKTGEEIGAWRAITMLATLYEDD